MIGLDIRRPFRAIQLKVLPENGYLVHFCDIADSLHQIPFSSQEIVIAIPDSHVLSKSLDDQNKDADFVWDHREKEVRLLKKKTLEPLLAPLKIHNISIHAIDIESEAMARALITLCDVADPYFALLYSDNFHIWLSVFEQNKKIFFYQESVQHNTDEIISRAFKLFNIRFPEIKIAQCFLIGDTEKIEHWGTVPNISQKLRFSEETSSQLFEPHPTQWLLACGLSLWDQKSSWNLHPWRESEKRMKQKLLLKYLYKGILLGFSIILILHAILLCAIYFQQKQNHRLEDEIHALMSKAAPANQAAQEMHFIQTQFSTLDAYLAQQVKTIDDLEKLNSLTPPSILLTRLEYNEKLLTFSLTGHAQSEAQLKNYLSLLEQQLLFHPKLTQSSQDVSSYPLSFTIEGELR